MEPTRRISGALGPADPFPHPDWSRRTQAAYWWGKPDDRPRPLLPSAVQQRAKRLAGGRVVIVCGGRAYADWERVWAALDRAHAAAPITLLVHGACIDRATGELQGADRLADGWAIKRQVAKELHPADWTTWGSRAESMRHHQMAAAGAHGLIAFPGGPEAASMARHARAHGIPVWRPFADPSNGCGTEVDAGLPSAHDARHFPHLACRVGARLCSAKQPGGG